MALFAQASLEDRSMCTVPSKSWHGTIALGCGNRLGWVERVVGIWSSGRGLPLQLRLCKQHLVEEWHGERLI